MMWVYLTEHKKKKQLKLILIILIPNVLPEADILTESLYR